VPRRWVWRDLKNRSTGPWPFSSSACTKDLLVATETLLLRDSRLIPCSVPTCSMQDRSWVQAHLASNREDVHHPGYIRTEPPHRDNRASRISTFYEGHRGTCLFAPLSVWFSALFLRHVDVANLAVGGEISCSVPSRAASPPLGFRAETRGGWYACSMNG
jgi:hypothetical protein